MSFSICMRICPTRSVAGEKKELHQIDGNTCIDCGACGLVCPVGAVEDPFGQVTQRMKKTDWPRPLLDKADCMSCGICIAVCPTGALGLGESTKNDPHAYPELIHEKACISCGFCTLECPVDALAMARPQEQIIA